MRQNKFLCAAAFFCLLMLFAAFLSVPLAVAAEQPVSAGETVLDCESGRILHERNADARLPMASTTKILTAVIILEDCDLSGVVTVPAEAAGTEGSSIYLQAGEKICVLDLLYGLMLRSGNDCAVTLALHHSGTLDAFAACMNERAQGMGAENSCFKNRTDCLRRGTVRRRGTSRASPPMRCATALSRDRFGAGVADGMRRHGDAPRVSQQE